MEHLFFSLNATVPVFLLMLVGYFLHYIGIIDKVFANKLNQFVFKAALPVLVFRDMSASDFYALWDLQFVLFCFFVSLISILLILAISCFMKNKSIQGEFIQASYRSSQALLGCALIENIYGDAGAATLMIFGAVPLYNAAAVIILALFKPDRDKLDKRLIKNTFINVVTNPIIIGILAGICWSLLRIPTPVIMEKTVSSFAGAATPMGLIALGASLDFKEIFHKIQPTMACTFFKLIAFTAMFLPLAIAKINWYPS